MHALIVSLPAYEAVTFTSPVKWVSLTYEYLPSITSTSSITSSAPVLHSTNVKLILPVIGLFIPSYNVPVMVTFLLT